MFDGDIENKVRSVKTQITYVARGSFVNRRFVAPGIEHNTGHYEPHTVMVRDGRSIASHFSLDVHGFSLFHHKSAVQDFFNKEEVDRTYPGEVAEAVKMSTGASSVA
ncbi:MAG: CmcJ/NvfI family oxidoreductase, partial [Rhizomicrobium sp.]